MDKLSYALGMVLAENLRGLGLKAVETTDLGRALNAVLGGGDTELTPAEAQATVSAFVRSREEERGKAMREAGERFLTENAGKEGVVTTASGLQYMELEKGTGRKPAATDQVRCHYEGRLTDGTVFDSSYRRGEPATFPLNGVIQGWTEGLQLMQEGAKFRFFIPYNLGYGERGAGGSIPPYATLVFDVELIKVL
ncbi:MAG: FKBP-type peptidyl-prolyl cis-trans isomerase [Alloprevotella sp.]|nr:FKBP-type peptidyl-prolyl cis-trans isomerase [Alloprevotella sp.]